MATGPLILAFLCLIFPCLVFFWRSSKKTSPVLINWPVTGMAPGLLCNASRLHDYFNQLLQSSRGTFLFKGPWFSDLNFLITSDSSNVHHILSKNFSNYGKGPDYKRLFFDLFGDGIFTSDGEEWRFQRKIIHSLFTEDKFLTARESATEHKILNGLFLVLDNAVESRREVDIQDVFGRLTFDIVCKLVLDHDPNCLSLGYPQVECEKAFSLLGEITFNRHFVPGIIWKLKKWLLIGKDKKGKKARETFERFLYDCISSKRENLASIQLKDKDENIEKFDLLTYFMVDKGEGNGATFAPLEKSDKLLKDIALNLVAAGRDTVSAGLTWFLWLVATHPTVEEAILKEIGETFRATKCQEKRVIFSKKEELSQLVYLQAAILETLRLYPPVPFEHVNSFGKDILPSGHHIGENTRILFSFYSMGRMEQIWGEDCLEFKPERWISEQGKIKFVSSSKFVAFNAGPRTCLGKELSLVQMQSVASAMIWNYRFELVESQIVRPYNSIALHMKHGLKVRVFKRYK